MAGDVNDDVILPGRVKSVWRLLLNRLLVAAGAVFLVAILVLSDRHGYRDVMGRPLSVIDAFYYSAGTLTTTGYGDIAPVSQRARLVNTLVVAPGRMMFLGLMVSTSFEVLTVEGRRQLRIVRWRRRMHNHAVVIGYGTKGRSAVRTLLRNGVPKSQIVVVDPHEDRVAEATERGIAVIAGDATRPDVLERAEIADAAQVLVCTDRDDTNLLAVLTLRQMNPTAAVVATARHQETVELFRQSGASSVVLSSDAVGRLLGLSAVSPTLGAVMEDLLSLEQELDVAERPVTDAEVGRAPRELNEQVLAVIRKGHRHHYFDPAVGRIEAGDKVVVIRGGGD